MKGHKFWGPNGQLAEMIRQHFPPTYQGHAIDVGASDGVSVNTTFTLEKMYSWTVLSVEPNPDFKPYLLANRTFVEMCACASESREDAIFHVHTDIPEAYSALTIANHPVQHAKPGARWVAIPVPVRTLDQLLAKWEFPRLDALCIDVEGTELDVLKGCDLKRWQPKVIVVECWDREGPMHDYVRSLNYQQAGTLVHNYVYVR